MKHKREIIFFQTEIHDECGFGRTRTEISELVVQIKYTPPLEEEKAFNELGLGKASHEHESEIMQNHACNEGE